MTATTASSPQQRLSDARQPGFGSAVASEWTKLRSVRSTWIIMFLAITLSIGFSALMSFVQGLTFDDWGPAEQAAFDPMINSFVGILFAIILLIVFSVLAVTSEYGSRMIRTTLIATPNRLRVLMSKLVIVAGFGLVLSLIMMPGMFFISQIIFDAYGMESVALGDEGVNRFLFVSILVGGLIYTVIPMSIGFLLRGTASAITASIGLFFLPWMFAPLLPRWVQENVIAFLPDVSMDSLAGVTSTDSATYLSQTPAIIAIIAWLVGSVVLAGILFTRRDA